MADEAGYNKDEGKVIEFKDTVRKSWPTGSRYICDPPVLNTDKDTVILVNGFLDWETALLNEGWERDGKDYGELRSDFTSYRKGDENYVVTEDEDFFRKFVVATEGAKEANLLDKEKRVLFFQRIFFSYDYPGWGGLVDWVESIK